jgi:hypothetical protein
MTLAENIERVFAHRAMPDAVIDTAECVQMDSDVEEALWFTGRDWHGLTWRDWQEHSCAIYFFDSEAFAYYLPSVLLLSAQHLSEELMAADSLISLLDCSPDPDGWPAGVASRFLELNPAELDVLKEWFLQICEYTPYKRVGFAGSGPGDRLGRAFDTLDLLRKMRCELKKKRSHR